jgi:hypothetical protein
LAERHAILGGATAVERTRALVEERQAAPVVAAPAPDHELRTPQKLAVLRAWAAYEMPEDVARAAGMDVRTANWQRSILKTKLGLEKAATRAEVLEAAVARRLLRADAVVLEPATASGAGVGATAVPSPGAGQRPVPSSSPARAAVPESQPCRRPGRRVHRRRVTTVAGQLSFDDALAPTPTAPVTALFSSKPVLEAAA